MKRSFNRPLPAFRHLDFKSVYLALPLVFCLAFSSHAQHMAMAAGVGNAFSNNSFMSSRAASAPVAASQPAAASVAAQSTAVNTINTANTFNTVYTQPADNNARTVSASSPASQRSQGGAIRTGMRAANPGSLPTGYMTRYNFMAKKAYPYHASAISKANNYHHKPGHIHLFHHHHHWYPFLYFYDVYVPVLFYICNWYDDDALLDSQPTHGASAMNASFDGYMVYAGDTISGVVTLTPDKVMVEQQGADKKETGYRTALENTKLKAVVLYDGNDELYMARIRPSDKKLSRVLHMGRLNVYDDRYDFPTPENVSKARLTVSYDGHIETPQSFLAADAKKLLIDSINQVYGLQLKAKDYTWKSLLEYLDGLD